MKKLFSTLCLLLAICTVMFAQATTGTESNSALDWIKQHLGTVLTLIVAVYEVVARYVPTIKNYSVISLIIDIIQFLVPNKNKTGGYFK